MDKEGVAELKTLDVVLLEAEDVALGEGLFENELVEDGDAPIVKLAVIEGEMDSEAEDVALGEGLFEYELVEDEDAPIVKLAVTESEMDSEAEEEEDSETVVD